MSAQFPGGPQARGGGGYDPWRANGTEETGAPRDAAPEQGASPELSRLGRGLSHILPSRVAERFVRRHAPLPERRTDAAMLRSSAADQPVDPAVARRELVAEYRLRLVEGGPLPAGLAPDIISELATSLRGIGAPERRIRAINRLLPAIRGLRPDLQEGPLAALAHETFDLRPDTLALRREVRSLASEGDKRLHISSGGHVQIVGALIRSQIADQAAEAGGPGAFVEKFGTDFFDGAPCRLPPGVSSQELSELALDIAGIRDEEQCARAFDAVLTATEARDPRSRLEPLLALAYSGIALPPYTWDLRQRLRDTARAAWDEGDINDGEYAEILAGLAYSQASAHLGEDYGELKALCDDIERLPPMFRGLVFGSMFTSEMERQPPKARRVVFDSAWARLNLLTDEDAKPGLVALATNLGHLKDVDAQHSAIERFLGICEGERAGLADDLAGIALRQIALVWVEQEELLERALGIVCSEPPLDVAPQVLDSDEWSMEDRKKIVERMLPVVMGRPDTLERAEHLATLIAWINEFDPEDQFPAFQKAAEAIKGTDMVNRYDPLMQARQLSATFGLHWHPALGLLRELGVESLSEHHARELWVAHFSALPRERSEQADGSEGGMQRGPR